MTVTRSAGIGVQVGGVSYIVGGGYKGKTAELDEIVEQEADWLAKVFSRDVEIRFNSDRESGGAWLKNSLPGFAGNCQVGLCAGIVCCKGHACGLPEGAIYIESRVYASALKDKALATNGPEDSEKYHWRMHDSVKEAVRWLDSNVDREAILT